MAVTSPPVTGETGRRLLNLACLSLSRSDSYTRKTRRFQKTVRNKNVNQRSIKLWDYLIRYSVQLAEKVTRLGRRPRSSEFLAASLRRPAACKVWPANSHRVGRATRSRPGLAWETISRFP